MKRSEEIQQKAGEEAWYIADTSQTKEEAAIRGYCLGVAYADRTMFDRVCSVFSDILIEICPELLGYGAGAKAWENKFRKRLKGGLE